MNNLKSVPSCITTFTMLSRLIISNSSLFHSLHYLIASPTIRLKLFRLRYHFWFPSQHSPSKETDSNPFPPRSSWLRILQTCTNEYHLFSKQIYYYDSKTQLIDGHSIRCFEIKTHEVVVCCPSLLVICVDIFPFLASLKTIFWIWHTWNQLFLQMWCSGRMTHREVWKHLCESKF